MKLIIILALFLLSSTNFASAEDIRLPFTDLKHGSFAAECKMPKKLKMKSMMTVYNSSASPEKIATLKQGEVVLVKEQFDRVLKPGVIQLSKNYKNYKKGDKAYLLSADGDGSYRIWYKGKVSTEKHTEDQEKIFVISDEEINSIQAEMWVKVEFSKGRLGYIKFTGSEDACSFEK